MTELWSGRVSNGKSVSMETIRISRTYAGLYEGYPNQELNDRILADARAAAATLFPGWPVYTVAPSVTTRQIESRGRTREYPRLPSFECIGKFVGSQTKDDDYHGSLLIVVWFQEESPLRSIQLQLHDLDWLQFAKDFWY